MKEATEEEKERIISFIRKNNIFYSIEVEHIDVTPEGCVWKEYVIGPRTIKIQSI